MSNFDQTKTPWYFENHAKTNTVIPDELINFAFCMDKYILLSILFKSIIVWKCLHGFDDGTNEFWSNEHTLTDRFGGSVKSRGTGHWNGIWIQLNMCQIHAIVAN